VPTVSKEVTPNPEAMPPGSKSSSFRRVTRSQGNKLSSEPEVSFIGINEQRRPRKKRLRTRDELASGSKPNHHEPVTVGDEVKGKGEPILGSPSFSSLSPRERKETEQTGKEQREKKISPKSAIVHEIHSDDEANEVPMFFREKPDSVFKKEEMKQDTDTQMQKEIEEQKPQGPKPKKKTPTVLEMYAIGPHTRPSNKLRFKFKLMENPGLKDMIINIDEEEIARGGSSSARKGKSVDKPKARVSKVKGMRVSKAEGLKMLAAVLNTL
jgi:hypothetical protein